MGVDDTKAARKGAARAKRAVSLMVEPPSLVFEI